MVAPTRNPWPVRLAIVGALMLILGAFLLNAQGNTIDEAYDARKVATLEATGPGSEVAMLEPGCYYAIAEEGEDNVDLNLTKLEGSARVDTALENKICKSDWLPMATDQTQFIVTSSWTVTEEGEYALDSTCQEGNDCADETVYLVHTNRYQYAAFSNPGLLLGFASCCLGLFILPLAGVVLALTRSSRKKTSVVMMNADGTMTQAAEVTPEMVAAFARGENPLQPKVDAPFADTGLSDTEEFIDGKESVMRGNLLTTEQVYALMRGDVDQASKTVSDPFADSPIKPQTNAPIKNPNTKTITSWDEGASDIAPATETSEQRRKIQSVKRTEPKEQSNKDWKSWDEI